MLTRMTTATTTGCPEQGAISFTGPDYATTDMRLSRRLYARRGWKLEFTAESFNLLNRLNRRFQITDEGLLSNAARFKFGTKHIGINYFPASYQVPTNFMRATNAIRAAAGAVCIVWDSKRQVPEEAGQRINSI